MSKITVSFSDKVTVDGRAPWAACSIERDVDDELLERPALVAEFVRQMYSQAESAVNLQLSRALPTARVANSPLDRPRIAPMTQAEVDAPAATAPPRPAASTPPAPPSTPPVVAPPNGKTYSGRGQDGPPTTGAQLGGWAKRTGCLPWFASFGQTNNLPKLCSQWSDEWAQYAFSAYGKACIPPAVPSSNGSGPPPSPY
jgi:hypothetical protein